MGRGTRAGDADVSGIGREAAGQDHRAGGRFRLDDCAALPPFEMQRTDAAYGLAVLLREIAEKVAVYSFSDRIVEVPARRGFALRDVIDASQPHSSTRLGNAVEWLNKGERYDYLIVITDEQAHDTVPASDNPCYQQLCSVVCAESIR